MKPSIQLCKWPMRLAPLCLCVTAFTSWAQPLLVHTDPRDSLDIQSVRSFQGAFLARITPVEVSGDLLVLVSTDTLEPALFDALRAGLLSIYQASGESHPLRIAVFRNGAIELAGPFRTRAEFQTALRQIQPGGDPGVSVLSGPKFYTGLPAALKMAVAEGRGPWPSVLLATHFPDIDPALLEYGTASLAAPLLAQRLRVGYWNIGGNAVPLLDAVAKLTGGIGVAEPASWIDRTEQALHSFGELGWDEPGLSRGFHLYTAKLVNGSGTVVASVGRIAYPSGQPLPDPEQYAKLIQSVKSAADLLQRASLNTDETAQVRAHLETALSINSRDHTALRLAADFYKRYNDHKTAAGLLASLTEIDPRNGALWNELGHEYFIENNLEAAEQALGRGRQLKAVSAVAAAELARIHLARHDAAGALPLLDESLRLDAKNQELWFLRADTCRTLNDWKCEAESLDRGIALGGDQAGGDQAGGDQTAHRTTLARLYLDHGSAAQASAQADRIIQSLPADPGVRATWAGFLEELKRPADALQMWRQTLELDKSREDAHYAVARLLLDKGDLPRALEASETGLIAAPRSARLQLAKAAALERQGNLYAARASVRGAAADTGDLALLRHEAELEDQAGGEASAAYARIVELLEKPTTASAPASAREEYHTEALSRGLRAALRDANPEKAAWFSQRLDARGPNDLSALVELPRAPGKTGNAKVNEIWIPGGTEALAFAAHGKARPSRERFLIEYARTVLDHSSSQKADLSYLAPLRDYFQRVAMLSALATRSGNRGVITLSLADKKAKQQTEKVLSILGWKLRNRKDEKTIESGEKLSQAKRQDLAAALAIDQVGMQEALADGKSYKIELLWDRVPIVLDEASWKNQFYPAEKYSGGLAEAIAYDPNIAKVYAGLSAVDSETAAALVAGMGLKALAEKYGDRLRLYSAALSIEGNRVWTPGDAEAIWTKLSGASPSNPPAFLRALFDKDDGKLLAYFYTLGELDPVHQKFFTLNAARATKFYELFRDAPELRNGAARELRHGSFGDFLREVPLDPDLTVDFPGSPEIWMVAEGQSKSAARTLKLMKRAHQKVAPDREDEILLHLANKHYKSLYGTRTELDNFLAVVRIEQHRNELLDEASALALAQNFDEYENVYPYFAVLTGLTQKEFEGFFRFGEKLRGMNPLELNSILGQFHSLLDMLRLGSESGALDEKRSTALFFALCDSFTRAQSDADYVTASLDIVRQIAAAAPGSGKTTADQSLRALLLGPARPVSVDWKGMHEVDASKAAYASFDRILDRQKVPAIELLLQLADASHALAAGQGSAAAHLAVLAANSEKLPSAEVPKGLKAEGKAQNSLKAAGTLHIREVVTQFQQKVPKVKKGNLKDIQKLDRDLLSAMAPQVTLALSGIVYAYYFRSSDLLIAEDPLLLRKHQFYPLNASSLFKQRAFSSSDLHISSELAGSYAVGGFNDFVFVAGQAALAGFKKADGLANEVITAQMGALRATPWSLYRDEDQQLLGLKIRIAREWCVEAARSPAVRKDLSEDTLGLLSLIRRRQLLDGLNARDWKIVWQSVTLSDLYFLGDRYLARYPKNPWQSPAASALRIAAAQNDGARLQMLGAALPRVNGCAHSHLQILAPYEEYERRMFSTELAGRSAEFKLYLAEYLDRAALPAGIIGAVAEPLVFHVLGNVNMSDMRDWTSVLSAYAGLNDRVLEGALPKP